MNDGRSEIELSSKSKMFIKHSKICLFPLFVFVWSVHTNFNLFNQLGKLWQRLFI